MTAPADDATWLRHTFALAHRARRRGDSPFGAALVSAGGSLLAEGENTAASALDPTGHAELNLLRGVLTRIDAETLSRATLYASGEPCPMCAAAIAWAGVARLVYAVSSPRLGELVAGRWPGVRFSLRAADVLARSSASVRVEGPVLEEEGSQVFL